MNVTMNYFGILFLPIFIEFQLFLHNIFSLRVKTNNIQNGNDLLSFGTVTCPSLPYLQKV